MDITKRISPNSDAFFMEEAIRRCMAESPNGNLPYLALVPCEPTDRDILKDVAEDYIEIGDQEIAIPFLISRGSVFPERTDKHARATHNAMQDALSRGLRPAGEPRVLWLVSPDDIEFQMGAVYDRH